MTQLANSDTNVFLRLSAITKKFGDQYAVDHLDLEMHQGEFISLLGPSGGGKTTTLHMIAGFLAPDAGDIILDGVSIQHMPSHRRGAVMVFQNYALFPHMTVYDNVAFGLRMQKLKSEEIRIRVVEALKQVHLDGFGHHYPRELSGGQQQRVALSRAIVLKPRLLLMDEPLSNLDPELRQELRKNALEIHKITGMTTILVTHDIEEAFTTSDRVAILGNGKLQQFDTPRNIYLHPNNAFVAGFIGHRNIIEGTLFDDNGTTWFHMEKGNITLPVPATSRRGQAQYIIPEYAITLQSVDVTSAIKQSTVSEIQYLSARIIVLDYLGASLRFEVETGGFRLEGKNTIQRNNDTIHVGDVVQLAINTSDLIELPQV